MNGACDFCPRPGRLATCMCVHEHRVGVWVCAERCGDGLATGGIGCRICDWDVPYPHRHWCTLSEVPAECSGCSMLGGRHWDTCPNRWDGRPTR